MKKIVFSICLLSLFSALCAQNTDKIGFGTTTPGSRVEIRGVNQSSSSSALNVTDSAHNSILYIRNDKNVGIGNISPANTLSVGTSSQFQINNSGNVQKINNVPYSWPSSQGASNSFLSNDGNGNLNWSTTPIIQKKIDTLVTAQYNATPGNWEEKNFVLFDSGLGIPTKTSAYTPKHSGETWRSIVHGDSSLCMYNGKFVDTLLTLNRAGITFTANFTGFSGSPPTTETYHWIGGGYLRINIPEFIAASNSASFSMTAPFKADQSWLYNLGGGINFINSGNQATQGSYVLTSGSTTITFDINFSSTGWASGGVNKGASGYIIYRPQTY